MKKLVLFAVAAALVMNVAQAADGKNKKDNGKGGFKSLFNGKNLKGWKTPSG